MAEYHLHSTNLPCLKEKHAVYPRLVPQKASYVKELLKQLSSQEEFPMEHAEKIVEKLFQQILNTLSEGGTVKVENFGTFSLTLGKHPLDKTENQQTTLEPECEIEINNIRFKAEKQAINWIKQHCNLELSEHETITSSTEFSFAQRLDMLTEYLNNNYFISVKDYCLLTGLQRNKAAKELKAIAGEPKYGIRTVGEVTHKIYALIPRKP